MEAWKRNDELVVVEDDGLEKKHIDRRNDYGTSSADEYQQQILEKTRLAFAAASTKNKVDGSINDTNTLRSKNDDIKNNNKM